MSAQRCPGTAVIFVLEIVAAIVIAVLVLRKLEGASAAVALVLGALGFLAVVLLELGRPREAVRLGAPVLAVLLLGGAAIWVVRRQPRVPGLLAGAVVGALVGVPLFVGVLRVIEQLGWRDAEHYPQVRNLVALAVVSLAAVVGGWVGWLRAPRTGNEMGPDGDHS